MNNNSKIPGAPKADLQEMPQIKNRYSFIYLEKCSLSKEDSAIKASWKDGYALIPAHSMMTLLLGPGTSLTHRAAQLIGEAGAGIAWVGDGAARFYGFGRPLTNSSILLVRQAMYVTKPALHMKVVKRMYYLRFPDEDMTNLTLQQLRGKEGARVKREYKKQAEFWGVSWTGRNYDPEDFHQSDPVNQSLSVANTCLYGICSAVIYALGLSPGLGFIHVNHEKSFIYDVADLYKAEITIPLAFEIGSKFTTGIPEKTRKEFRNRIHNAGLIERMVKDIKFIFDLESDEIDYDDTLVIWDGIRAFKQSGTLYQTDTVQQGE